MSDNSTPNSYVPLIEHLEDAADGAKTYGTVLGLAHNTEAFIRTDLEALVGKPAGPGGIPPAVPGLKSLWNTARTGRVIKNSAFNQVCTQARSFARTCIHSLAPVLGETWNTQWGNAGFTGGSLAIPANPLTLLQQFRAYFSANPARETLNIQGVACTAAACDAMEKNLIATETAVNQADTDASTAYSNFQAGLAAGRARLSGLRGELSQLMDDDDDRWYAFGFAKPSDPSTPDVPGTLTVTAGAPGSAVLNPVWPAATRATSYRLTVTLKSDGSEVTNQIVKDCQTALVLDSVTAGTIVDVTVTARNSAGESGPSNAVEIAVP